MTDDKKSEPAEDVPVLQFAEAYKKFSASLKSSFEADRFKDLEKTSEELITSDKDNKKLTLDQCFREYLTKDLQGANPKIDLDKAQRFFQFAIMAARKELCNPTTPIQVLADVFDILPLSSCEVLFKSVEIEVPTWRSATFYQYIKNSLLRICNDLLRRLSRTQNTVFCGRIQLFLAKFFPFSERSGLNVISEFNLDNVTGFSKKPLVAEKKEEANGDKKDESKEKDEGDTVTATKEKKKDEEKGNETEPMEIELIVEEEEKLEVEKKKDADEEKKEETTSGKAEKEFALYSQFWKLQDFFRNPTQCYEKDQWEKFCEYTAQIVQTFSKKKLDTRGAKKETKLQGKDPAVSFVDQYFAKYLTNQNLLTLQLNDSNFRRYVLVQYLIIFQYLQTSVKFKTDAQVLSTEQTKWIDDQRKKIFKLLDETPPNGRAFSSSVKSILKRELIWIKWKNEGCPSFVIKKTEVKSEEKKPAETEEKKSRKRKITLGEMMKRDHKAKKINLGNKGLTKLWNLSPDNLAACKAQERNFLPSLEAFFEEAIEEIDPRNKVEESYKKVNNGEWGWRALRLMSRRSQHFFLLGNSQISKLPEYLEMMMGKMANDFGKPIQPMEEVEPVKNGGEESAANGDSNGGAAAMSAKLTDEQLATLTEKLSPHWKALVPKLGLPTEKIDEMKAQGSDMDICLKLLMAWVDQEGDGASPDEISYILGGLKLAHLTEGVF